MAYLLHPSSIVAPSVQDHVTGENASGAGLFGPVRSLLHCVHAALHGAASHGVGGDGNRAFRGSSSDVPQHSGARQRSPGDAASSPLPASGTSSSSSQEEKPNATYKAHAGNRCVPFAATRFARPSFTSRTPQPAAAAAAATAVPAHRRSSGAGNTAVTSAVTSDAELYRRAVDFADVAEVLRCPLPPVEGCPTLGAYGGNLVKGDVPTGEHSSAASPAGTPPPPPPLAFRCIGADPDTGITIYSTPVEDCPMHLMRAYAILPCAPRDVLQYMDNDVRPQWDTYIRRSALLRELPPPEVAAEAKRTYGLSSSIGTAEAGVGRRSPTSLSARAQPPPYPSDPHPSATAMTALPTHSHGFSYQPGQRRVAIHYLETRSPVPFVQDRDFELVVAEEVLPDGTAYSKALSTPFGYHMPLDPQQSRYVRGVVLLSGLVARPLDAAVVDQVLPPMLRRHRASFAQQTRITGRDSKAAQRKPLPAQRRPPAPSSPSQSPPPPSEYCVLEYVGLVHPMGMLPAVLVNVVISAQLNAMRKMQAFIARHPMSTLRPRGSAAAAAAASLRDRPALRATVPPLKELSAALRAAPSGAAASSRTAMSTEEKREGAADVAATSPTVGDGSVSTHADQTSKSTGCSEEGERQPGTSTEKEAGKTAERQKRQSARSWWRWRPGPFFSRL
ncbi:hypothetical protein ABB37_05709 [Leptomonas pyrrhocoris]|uniref:START domain-containing protein n=1 Tax=Leptomonas pyrrhocoris TaxID=157538 RepID=A0A0M9FZS2_LEPPY|nr:hypothetical protein ABB37_05709 [Leptomonas pyrrhocoris]XP_015657666.1 hypothetical protein ABB37_05709 [Leptomonas pyrrhocoris]KPA79226.1 hypothetical protein ABB37_05709 [Leptomonas pyrrhocoris]KPA79227.1 hypothetical protein ABB37_05709 [Leptomonas pyrrhocoris]|eukprot:XP_015657665.1 hypothetical protein ABB37_05709 [Leptomonas pyrrhocoris]